VTLTLSGTNDLGQSITATVTTAANGSYSFATDSSGNKLRPGTYQVVQTPPAGYLTGAATAGTVNGTSNGSADSPTQISSIVLAESQSGINYNFGDLKPVTIAGTVYEDTNNNGKLDSGEPGIAGVSVTLTGTNDQGLVVTATATTAANGSYSFSTDSSGNVLRPGTYQVVETPPAGYKSGAATAGTVNGSADGTVVSPVQIGSIGMGESQSGINYNFGNIKPVSSSISGYVYVDSNGDTLKDNGETGDGQPDQIVLTGTDIHGNSVNLTAFTDASGFYSFTGLTAGTYTLTYTSTPEGYLFEYANVGTVNGAANGQNIAANSINQIVLSNGAGVDYDFAEIIAGS
jgi:hypothetical protein